MQNSDKKFYAFKKKYKVQYLPRRKYGIPADTKNPVFKRINN